jgi:hypothetical protein
VLFKVFPSYFFAEFCFFSMPVFAPGPHQINPAQEQREVLLILFGREKAIKSFLDAQNLSGSFDMVRHELDASRQRPAHRQKIDRLDGVPAMLFVHAGGQLPFLSKRCSRLISFKFRPSLRAEMPALPMPANERPSNLNPPP